MGVIIFNIFTMAMPFYNNPNEYETTLNSLNYFFTSVFIVEFILKVFSLSFIRYIINPWNKFDFLVVMASILEIILNNISSDNL